MGRLHLWLLSRQLCGLYWWERASPLLDIVVEASSDKSDDVAHERHDLRRLRWFIHVLHLAKDSDNQLWWEDNAVSGQGVRSWGIGDY